MDPLLAFSFLQVIWWMIIVFFWTMFIWMFISVFADIFRRDDLSGWGKVAWILLIVFLPLLGILIYIIVRPKVTPSDVRLMEQQRRMAGHSPAEEITKAQQLRDSGAITAEEFEEIKRRAMA